MKKPYLLLIAALTVTTIAIVSCSGKRSPEKMREQNGRRQVLSDKKDVPDVAVLPENVSYIVRLENSTLTLYEQKNGEETVLQSIKIDTTYYPSEDIKELSAGITAYSKEDGFARMENFSN